jgi:hypothetical protein
MLEIQGQNTGASEFLQLEAANKKAAEQDGALVQKDAALENNIETIDNNDLHQEVIDQAYQKTDTPENKTNSLQDFFQNGPPWFQFFRNYFVMGLNLIGIGLNTSSVVASNSNIFSKETAEYLDKASEWYSRYVVSIGFSWNGIESFVGKRPLEAMARLIPALGFMTLPFYNFNLATGVSSGLSYILGMLVQRNGNKQPGQGSAWENTKGIIQHSKEMLKDTFNPDAPEDFFDKFAMHAMMTGSLGGLLFASHKRDSFAARLFGNLRNFGGLSADYKLIFNKDKTWRGNHQRIVGSICTLASFLNIVARWVDPKLARALNHLAIAADDLGLTYWAQMSKEDNDEAAGKKGVKSETVLKVNKVEPQSQIFQNLHSNQLKKPDLSTTLAA